MPQKFQCYVPKGASRKRTKVDEVKYRDAAVQTVDTAAVLCSVEVQTDGAVGIMNDAAPSTTVCEAEV